MKGGSTREPAMDGTHERERIWLDAWHRALPLVDGAARGRLPGASPGVELAFLDWGGEGPLVVLLHANGFGAAIWAAIASALCRRFRIVALDMRGHGDSTPVDAGSDPAAYTWTTLAADVDCALGALLEQTGAARIALGVGHSMGGALVAANAVARPERFERLLLCDPVLLPPAERAPAEPASAGSSPHGTPPQSNPMAASARKRRDRFPSAAEAYAHCRSRALYAAFTPEALALYVGLGMRELESGERILKCAPAVEGAIFASAGMFDLREAFAQLAPELVILHAGRGNFSRPYYEALAARAPNARVEGVDGQHLFPMEAPQIVIDWIERMMPSAPTRA